MAEDPAVDGAKKPYLNAEGKDPVHGHFGNKGLQKLTEGPVKLYPVNDIGVAAHNGAHQKHGEAGADALIENLIICGILGGLLSGKLLHHEKLQDKSKGRFLAEGNTYLSEKLKAKLAINEVFVVCSHGGCHQQNTEKGEYDPLKCCFRHCFSSLILVPAVGRYKISFWRAVFVADAENLSGLLTLEENALVYGKIHPQGSCTAGLHTAGTVPAFVGVGQNGGLARLGVGDYGLHAADVGAGVAAYAEGLINAHRHGRSGGVCKHIGIGHQSAPPSARTFS